MPTKTFKMQQNVTHTHTNKKFKKKKKKNLFFLTNHFFKKVTKSFFLEMLTETETDNWSFGHYFLENNLEKSPSQPTSQVNI